MRKRIVKFFVNLKAPKAMTWFFIALMVVTAFAAVAVIRTQVEIREKKQKLERIETQCQVQTIENRELDDLIKNGSQYIERRAREDLDMVLPGERVYIIRAGS